VLCINVKVLFVNRSRGFGFVIFTNPESLDSVQAARPHEVDGRVVDTKRALPKSVKGSLCLFCIIVFLQTDDSDAGFCYASYALLCMLDLCLSGFLKFSVLYVTCTVSK